MNGYKKPHAVTFTVPAEMLESWAGYDEQDAEKELLFAVAALDINHPATILWLVCGLERRLAEIETAS